MLNKSSQLRLYVYRFQKDDSYFGSEYLTDAEATQYNLDSQGILYAVPWGTPLLAPPSEAQPVLANV